MNKAAEVREKAGRDLLKKYGSKLPLDFEAQIEDKIKPELDKIAQEFVSGSSEKVTGTRSLPRDIIEAPLDALLGIK